MRRVGIVILHFSHKDLTSKCLDSVAKIQISGFELQTIVVNNNPKEDLSSLKEKFPKIILLESPKNLGFAGGNNLGIKKALKNKADFILILNNDTFLDKNLLVFLVKTAESKKQSG
ncbi:MAG: glycosyltransferase, partial [Candidatus Shapirobacteria bacterium]|nr:glycosyltransferase [Candidatus Shapirobacteria bacterium]